MLTPDHDQPAPPYLVGTLADDSGPGTLFRLGEDEPVAPRLAQGQGVAAVVWHPALPLAYGLSMGPEGRLLGWRHDGGRFTPVLDLPSHGTVPCHLAVDPDGRFLVITNYGTGSLTVFALDADGLTAAPSWLQSLPGRGPHPVRQRHAHAHHVAFINPTVLVVNDLGSDAIVSFTLDRSTGQLSPLHRSAMPAGSGPRHLVRLGNNQVAISGELDNTVILGSLDPETGEITMSDTAPSSWDTHVRDRADESTASDIVTDGQLIYVANRGYNTVACLRADGGTLTPLQEFHAGGDWPQHLALRDDLLLVACQRSDAVTMWRRSADGSIDPLRRCAVPRPAWLITL